MRGPFWHKVGDFRAAGRRSRDAGEGGAPDITEAGTEYRRGGRARPYARRTSRPRPDDHQTKSPRLVPPGSCTLRRTARTQTRSSKSGLDHRSGNRGGPTSRSPRRISHHTSLTRGCTARHTIARIPAIDKLHSGNPQRPSGARTGELRGQARRLVARGVFVPAHGCASRAPPCDGGAERGFELLPLDAATLCEKKARLNIFPERFRSERWTLPFQSTRPAFPTRTRKGFVSRMSGMPCHRFCLRPRSDVGGPPSPDGWSCRSAPYSSHTSLQGSSVKRPVIFEAAIWALCGRRTESRLPRSSRLAIECGPE
jgi:hypothetical protein